MKYLQSLFEIIFITFNIKVQNVINNNIVVGIKLQNL